MNFRRYLNIRRFVVVVILITFALSLSVQQPTTVHAAVDFALTLSLDGASPTPPTPVHVGQTLTYRIDYSCNSLTVSCGQLNIQDLIDANLTVLNVSVASGYTAVVAGNNITITNPDFQDGSTSEAVVTVRVNLNAPASTVISNSASGTIQLNGE